MFAGIFGLPVKQAARTAGSGVGTIMVEIL